MPSIHRMHPSAFVTLLTYNPWIFRPIAQFRIYIEAVTFGTDDVCFWLALSSHIQFRAGLGFALHRFTGFRDLVVVASLMV